MCSNTLQNILQVKTKLQNSLYHMTPYRHTCSLKALTRLREHTPCIIVITSRSKRGLCLSFVFCFIVLFCWSFRDVSLLLSFFMYLKRADWPQRLASFSAFCSPRTEKYSDSGLRLPPLLREMENSSLGSCLSLLLSFGSKGAYTSEHGCARVPILLHVASRRITCID